MSRMIRRIKATIDQWGAGLVTTFRLGFMRYRVTTALGGAETIKQIEKQPTDAAVFELEMAWVAGSNLAGWMSRRMNLAVMKWFAIIACHLGAVRWLNWLFICFTTVDGSSPAIARYDPDMRLGSSILREIITALIGGSTEG